ncbi:MAG: hypothetical protein ABFS12_10685, partial [Bacteroidota bacterium]
KVENSLAKGSTIIFTTGFLANAVNGEKLAELAGVEYPIVVKHQKATHIVENNSYVKLEKELDLESKISVKDAEIILTAAGKNKIPFLIRSKNTETSIYTLNTHTFSQKDFDKVGEVLLCPRQLGLLDLPRSWTNKIRESFNSGLNIHLDAPSRVVIQPIGNLGWIFHNYNKTETTISFTSDKIVNAKLINGLTGGEFNHSGNNITLNLKPRSRIFVKIN